jgi:hypothetical protein
LAGDADQHILFPARNKDSGVTVRLHSNLGAAALAALALSFALALALTLTGFA